MFKFNKICITKCSMRENLIKEKHGEGLYGHFGNDKTFSLVSDFYYCPKMQSDIKIFVKKRGICQHAKERSQNTRL